MIYFLYRTSSRPLQYNTQHFKFDQICSIRRISNSSKYGRGAGRLDISPDCKGSNFTRTVSGERSRALLYIRGLRGLQRLHCPESFHSSLVRGPWTTLGTIKSIITHLATRSTITVRHQLFGRGESDVSSNHSAELTRPGHSLQSADDLSSLSPLCSRHSLDTIACPTSGKA